MAEIGRIENVARAVESEIAGNTAVGTKAEGAAAIAGIEIDQSNPSGASLGDISGVVTRHNKTSGNTVPARAGRVLVGQWYLGGQVAYGP